MIRPPPISTLFPYTSLFRSNDFGLSNVHQERFAFGQGWRVERFSVHMVAPEPMPIIGFPRTYSPSTKGTITGDVVRVDRKSTRLNSSHGYISYAVFCLKKKS